MAGVRLTAGRIRDFECPQNKQQVFLWDSVAPGLGVRATAGAKVFIFQGRLNGKTIRIKIGDCRTWVIEQQNGGDQPGARQEARRLQGLIDQSIDPRLEKKERIAETEHQQAEAKRESITIQKAWDDYIEARRAKWSERHLFDHKTLAKSGGEKKKRGRGKIKPGPLASLMVLRLSDLTPERAQAWAESETEKRASRARLAFSLLRAFINWCDENPEYAGLADPKACSTRIKRETIPKMKPKTDCLQREQLPAWFKAVRELSNPVASAYLQTLLLTGARRRELANLAWSDLDLKWRSMTIHDKVENERVIPLTPYVAALLDRLPRHSQWVFSSPSAKKNKGKLQDPRIPHSRALAVAGINGLTLHGLRRSFGTLSEWVEVPAGVVAQIMGHKPSATAEKHYR